MNNLKEQALELIDFIYKSPTSFHAVDSIKKMLIDSDFIEILNGDEWNLEKGKKYFTIKNNSAIIAFTVGNGNLEKSGFRIIGTHLDTPSIKIKPNPEMIAENSYLKLNCEIYGGPILNTWLDRPLAMAGRVSVKSDDPFSPVMELINIDKPIIVIPNLAIHMNREVNKGVELNKQTDMIPVLGLVEKEFEKDNFLIKLLAKELNVDFEKILDFDLFLYEHARGDVVGLNEEMISSPRIDNLESTYAGIKALVDNKAVETTNVVVCFDNEEVGSRTMNGAGSPILLNLLERISISLKKNREDFFRSLDHSYIVSADAAHAVHPNKSDKSDPTTKPEFDKGPVIKISANQNYTSDSFSSAVFENICKKADVPVQKFVNRSDERGGSTIGPISSTQVNINSVDVGVPILAMHSMRELCSVLDHAYFMKVLKKYFSL